MEPQPYFFFIGSGSFILIVWETILRNIRSQNADLFKKIFIEGIHRIYHLN